MTILQDLFYGNLAPFDGNFNSHAEYAQAVETLVDNEGKLMEILEDKDRELLSEFSDAHSALNSIMAEMEFIKGFKMGVLMMMEIISDRA